MERESSLRRSVEEAVGGGTPWMEAGVLRLFFFIIVLRLLREGEAIERGRRWG